MAALGPELNASRSNPPCYDLIVILTATIRIAIRAGNGAQQNSSSSRRSTYEASVRGWATRSNLPVLFVENSGANLDSLRQQVPLDRKEPFAFLSIPRATPANLTILHDGRASSPPAWNGLDDNLGQAEAQIMRKALDLPLVHVLSACPFPMLLKVTARFFVPELERIVRESCLQRASSLRAPPPVLMVQSTRHPPSGPHDWRPEGWGSDPSHVESQVVGFTPDVADRLLLETIRGALPGNHASFERGLSAAVAHFSQSFDQERRICWLPRMQIDPTREGSSGVERSFL